MKRDLALSALVAAVTMAVYWAVRNYGIVDLDDYTYLISHEEVSQGLSWRGVRWAFTWAGDAMLTPLTWISYMLDYTLWGENFGAMHLHSVLLHGLAAGLCFWLFRRVGTIGAMLIALVWALHPLRVESVAWLASRKDVLSTVFFLAALLAWTRSRGTWGLVVSLVLLAVGGLAKSSVMVFPAFVLAYDFLVARERKPIWAYAVALVMALGLAAEAAWAQHFGGATEIVSIVPLWYRLVNAVAALTVYAGNLVWPQDLAVQCIMRYPNLPRFSLLGAAVLAAGGWYAVRTLRAAIRERRWPRDPILVGMAVCVVALGPFLGIAGFGAHALADRFTILPTIAIGLCLLPVVRRRTGLVALAAAVALLGWRTMHQVDYWQNDERLFSHTLEVDGDGNMMIHKMLATYYYEFPHDYAKVYEHLKGLPEAPEWLSFLFGHCGHLFVEAAYETGHDQEALDFCGWMKQWNDRYMRAGGDYHGGRTSSYMICEAIRLAYTEGQLEAARELYERVRRLDDNSYAARNLRYIIARRSGDAEETAAALRDCYVRNPKMSCWNRWALEVR